MSDAWAWAFMWSVVSVCITLYNLKQLEIQRLEILSEMELEKQNKEAL